MMRAAAIGAALSPRAYLATVIALGAGAALLILT